MPENFPAFCVFIVAIALIINRLYGGKESN